MSARDAIISFLAAGMAAAGLAHAADTSQQALIAVVKRDGWSKACPHLQAKIDALKEPPPTSGKDWHDYVRLKGWCLVETRHEAEAIAFLKGKLALGRGDPCLLNILGTSQFRSGLDEEAIASFEEALANGLSEHSKPSVYSKLTGAYLKKASSDGRLAEPASLAKAEHYARLALASEKEPAPAVYSQLAHVKMAQQKPAEAIELLKLALEKNATYEGWPSPGLRTAMDAQFLMSLGQAHYQKGERERGLSLMDAAVDTAPTESQKRVLNTIRDSTLEPRPVEPLPRPLEPFVPFDKGA